MHTIETARRTPRAVQDCHDILLWLIPHLDKFPRSRRFTLGERLESGMLVVLEHLVTAAYTRRKDESLRIANTRLEVVRHLWRLSHELRMISTSQYQHGAELLLIARSSSNPRKSRAGSAHRGWC